MLHCSRLVRSLHRSRLAGTVRSLPVHHTEGSHNLALAPGIADIDRSHCIADTVGQVERIVLPAGMSWHWGETRQMAGDC